MGFAGDYFKDAPWGDRLKVAVIYGGVSGEHSISCATAAKVLSSLDQSRYWVFPIAITTSGAWVRGVDSWSDLELSAEVDTKVAAGTEEITFRFTANGAKLGIFDTQSNEHFSIPDFDVIFPLLHGPFGEDGTLQGLLEMAKMRYVGSGVVAASVGMDKHRTKVLVNQAGIEVAPWVYIDAGSWNKQRAEKIDECLQLRLPLFVKPARAGSSLGVVKVETYDELEAAISKATEHDPCVLVEEGVAGKEVEVAVLEREGGTKARYSLQDVESIGSQVYFSPTGTAAAMPGTLVFDDPVDFYDFDTKYAQSARMHLEIPANLPGETLAKIQQDATKVFESIGCEGLARVDFFVDDCGRVVFNEINTLPGFTPFSMYPKAWEKMGVEYGQILDILIAKACARPLGLR